MREFTLIFLMANFWTFISAQGIVDSSIVVGELLLYFESDEFELKEADMDSLSRFVADAPDSIKYYVDAHTDPVGSSDYNMKLSEKRTSSVVLALKDLGLQDSLISSSYYGESQIFKRGDSESANQLNRRARVRAAVDQKMIYLKGRIFDKDNDKGLEATVLLNSGLFEIETTADTNGLFSIISPLDEDVTIEILAKDYFIEASKIRVTRRHIDVELKIPLPKLELGKRYLFKNMLFEGNVCLLLPSSESAAFHLKRFMTLEPEVCIEIGGHVNVPNKKDVERNTSHFELSVARALEVKEILLEAGIGEERMIARGFGNWKMKYPEAIKAAESRLNRRVEIGIISCEESRNGNDDKVEDLDRYRIQAIDRYYNSDLVMSEFTSPFTGTASVTRILLQASAMLDQNMIPEKYTYREIFDAYPDLPVKE